MKLRFKNIICRMVLALAIAILLSGCEKADKNTDIVFTTEFGEDEVFRIDNASCSLPEIKVYMRTSQDQYESLFGSEIWGKDIGGTTLGDQLKDTILARLAQIKVMTLLADEYGIMLDENEQEICKAAAKAFVSGLSPLEIDDMQADTDLIEKMYSEYALSNKVYEHVTKDVNPEISDDEARTIKVKHILIKNYTLDSNGKRVNMTQLDDLRAKAKCRSILEKIQAGADFDEMAQEYNEDDETSYAFMKGTMPESFEEAAFQLDTDEVSGIVTTEYGYHIIKCISTFDQAETDANKEKIVQQRKNEAFNSVYTDFVKTVYSNLNEKLWETLEFEKKPEITTTNFFDIYSEYMAKAR